MKITMFFGRCLPYLVLVVTNLLFLGQTIVDSNIISCIEEEREALLVFKQGLVDEKGNLSSWGKEDEKKNCCQWFGIQCDNRTGHVNVLDLGQGYYFGLAGPIPPELGNLSRLQYLDLSYNHNLFSVGNLEWLSHLSSLKYLDLSWSNLGESKDWFQQVNKLPFLKTLRLDSCNLPPIIPSSLLLINSTASLEVLDLSDNNITSSINSWLFNVSSNLFALFLDENNLQGPIPDAIGNTIHLGYLFLESNDLEGGIPKFFGNMCSLMILDLSSNNLSGFIENLLDECTDTVLQRLNLGGNQFVGSMPDLSRFSCLEDLNLEQNRLNGTLSKSIGQLSKLVKLMLSANSLEGVISEDIFSNLSSLLGLELSGNSLTLEFRHDWVPPFQLHYVGLSSCKMGPHFPKWLQHLNYYTLDISHAGIADTIPDWFWNQVPKDNPFKVPYHLNLSYNQIKGRLPDLYFKLQTLNIDFGIDISSNHFEGPIPALPSNAVLIVLSKNKFSGTISFLCSAAAASYIDLSDNLFSGSLPDCFEKFYQIRVLNLANNGFSGNIPYSMGALTELRTLSLRNTSLSGDLPSSLKNCTKLRVLNLGMNALSGKIPSWIGERLPHLVILSLRSNRFLGNIPFQLCHLAEIQILDLSLNNISGTIPNCVKNFTAMTEERSLSAAITDDILFFLFSFGLGSYSKFFDSIQLRWKGNVYEYKNTLRLVKIVDLSSNELGGMVPEEIMSLTGLIALNLSRNHLTGQINQKIDGLKSLDFLDLSRNQLFGEIPSSLSLLDRLSVLDLSNNYLTGKIPLGTQLQSFNASAYAGNPGLCGLPLPNKCPWEEPAQGPNINNPEDPEDADQFITLGFYVSMVLGFILGFWGVCGSLFLNNSWRHAYFNFLTSIKDWLYVTTAWTIDRLQRRL